MNNAISIASGSPMDSKLEEIIRKKDANLKELAIKNAKHFAKRNLPAVEDDKLENYTGELKTGYEMLASDVLHHLQPGANFPEAKMDADYFKDRDKSLETEILEKQSQIHNHEYELGNHSEGNIGSRIRWAVIASLMIFSGEVIFNSKSFQVTGENFLFSLILSISISFTVMVFSHMVPFLYKETKSTLYRRGIIIGSLIFVTLIFSALAIFRTRYLANHEVNISPGYFILFNLFFFVVSTLFSFSILPSWSELKENSTKVGKVKAIKKLKDEIQILKAERDRIKQRILENTKQRVRIGFHANYVIDRLRKMYWETLEVFKSTNRTFRTDGAIPDCFSDILPEPNIEDFSFSLTTSNTKQS